MAEIIKKSGKRLTCILDPVSFKVLCRIRLRHGDRSFTASIKRAIEVAFFIEQKTEQEGVFFLKDKKENEKIQEIIFL